MSNRRKTHKQKLYKMKGCFNKTSKNYLGGYSSDINLAYPSNNVQTVPNPFLAYTGKGGSICNDIISSSNNLAYTKNINGSNPAYPSTGPVSTGFNFLNPQGIQHGGGCGCGLQMGGSCGATCGLMSGGGRHRKNCKCSMCKMKGGSNNSNNGIPYPNGLVGNSWTPSIQGWPGVDGISGDRNYLSYNTYSPIDISRQMINTGANPPFSVGGKGKKGNKNMKQRGGVMSNLLSQDLINLGRQFQHGFGSAYNALAGYPAPVSPMPWKDQLQNSSSFRI